MSPWGNGGLAKSQSVLPVGVVSLQSYFWFLHLRYDIALLRLSSEATLNSYVQLGSLPPSGQILPHNNPCYITGWGRTSSELAALSLRTPVSFNAY